METSSPSLFIASFVFASYCTFAAVSLAAYQFLPALHKPTSWLTYAGQQIVAIWHADVKAIEWFSGTLMILWALWLLPSNAFSVVPSVYFGMAAVGSESAWGTILLCIGVAHGVARLLPLSHRVRTATMLAVTAGWLGVAIPLIRLGWATTAAPIYSSLVAISLWAYVREAVLYEKTPH